MTESAGPLPQDGAGRPGGLLIAVDGPAGSGKSSAARGAARALGLRYLDTGAMYRALTWWLLSNGIRTGDRAAVSATAGQLSWDVGTDPDEPVIRLNGTDISRQIRTRDVSNNVSAVASIPQVRRALVALQRQIIAGVLAAGQGIVAEGRDVGTVVAPQATVKVFLTASELARARRRASELGADPAATVELTQAEQARRDRADARQTVMAADAIEIDTTTLTLDEVIDRITSLAAARGVVR